MQSTRLQQRRHGNLRLGTAPSGNKQTKGMAAAVAGTPDLGQDLLAAAGAGSMAEVVKLLDAGATVDQKHNVSLGSLCIRGGVVRLAGTTLLASERLRPATWACDLAGRPDCADGCRQPWSRGNVLQAARLWRRHRGQGPGEPTLAMPLVAGSFGGTLACGQKRASCVQRARCQGRLLKLKMGSMGPWGGGVRIVFVWQEGRHGSMWRVGCTR